MAETNLSSTSALADWLRYLETLHPTEIDLGLDRIREVAQRLELQVSYLTITVGGTNGKGSTCAMLEAILSAAGYKVGLYSSPHLLRYNERIRVAQQEASDTHITQQFARIEAARESLSLSYFEFATLAALLLFEQAKVDVAILEVGLGGRLDAVNLVDADCAIVTSIDIDHEAYLGNTREAVAFEKAHIFRPGRPAICADPLPPDTLIAYAQKIDAPLWLLGKDFSYRGDAQQWVYRGHDQRNLALAYPSLRGVNQLLNASAALAALEALKPRLAVPMQAIREGLHRVHVPGRLQILPGTPQIILDVAHNPHAAAALAQNLAQMPTQGKTYAVLGMLNDKDVPSVLRHLLPSIDEWFVGGLESQPRGLSADALKGLLDLALQEASCHPHADRVPPESSTGHTDHTPSVKIRVQQKDPLHVKVSAYATVVEAFQHAQHIATPPDRIVVFGSFATVGPILHYLNTAPATALN